MSEVFNPTGPEFWVLVATVIFLAIAWKVGGFAQLTAALDQRAARIQKELDEATSLREEAQRLLAEYQTRRHEAEAEAQAVVEAAKVEAERLKVESAARTEEFIARRTRIAEQKISQAEAQAVADVRAAAAEAAISAASTVLAGEMGSPASGAVMKAAIAEVTSKLN
jgi:F-type H+-transporting ATPase subunit b